VAVPAGFPALARLLLKKRLSVVKMAESGHFPKKTCEMTGKRLAAPQKKQMLLRQKHLLLSHCVMLL
jgi:hypothetical protein